MTARPEYVTCCIKTWFKDGAEFETWCERRTTEFAFVDVTHAALNGAVEGRLVLCRSCRDAIVRALDNGATR